MFGSKLYTKEHRLGEVLALIQVLALNSDAHRSEKGLTVDLKGAPKSVSSWMDVAREHAEFFRVSEDAEHGVSLVARHVMPREAGGREELSAEFTHELLKTAIDLYHAEMQHRDRWRYLVPLGSALVGGLLVLLGTIFG